MALKDRENGVYFEHEGGTGRRHHEKDLRMIREKKIFTVTHDA